MKLIYDEHEGQGTYVKSYEGVKPPEFRQTVSEFLMSGFEIKENRSDNNSGNGQESDSAEEQTQAGESAAHNAGR